MLFCFSRVVACDDCDQSGSDRTDEFVTSLCRLINEEWSDASSTGISSSQSSIESGMKTLVGM